MTTQKQRRDKTEHERRGEGRRVDDGAKKKKTMEEMRKENEQDRKGERRERVTAGVKGTGREGKKERDQRERESGEDRYLEEREKERKRRVSDSLSSSARNCCPEIRRTIRSCQDQH